MLPGRVCACARAATHLQGETLGDMRHGKGLHTCSNGDVYKGYWRLDKRHGRGMAVLANGMQYEGEWVEDMAHGYAQQTFLALCIVDWQRGPQQRACDAQWAQVNGLAQH